MALDYWRGRAQQAEHHARALEDTLRDLRGRMNETIEENARIAMAARAFARAVQGGQPAAEIAAAASELNSALHARHTLKLCAQLDESVSIYIVAVVLKEMFVRLKLRKEFAQAAEKWVFKELRKRRVSTLAKLAVSPTD